MSSSKNLRIGSWCTHQEICVYLVCSKVPKHTTSFFSWIFIFSFFFCVFMLGLFNFIFIILIFSIPNSNCICQTNFWGSCSWLQAVSQDSRIRIYTFLFYSPDSFLILHIRCRKRIMLKLAIHRPSHILDNDVHFTFRVLCWVGTVIVSSHFSRTWVDVFSCCRQELPYEMNNVAGVNSAVKVKNLQNPH